MKTLETRLLGNDEVLSGYDAVSALYPHVPSLSHWRAWECAAYRHHRLDGRILDLGCGDGRYFRLMWPEVRQVIGIDANAEVVKLARSSGIYERVELAPAQAIPEPDGAFDHVFANCSLEHMDELATVLGEISRCLKPGGSLLCSVVTDRFERWNLLPAGFALAGHEAAAASLRLDFRNYHHLANPLEVAEWVASFARAGLVTQEHIPILPMMNAGAFLVVDNIWHVRRHQGGEFGDVIHPFLSRNAHFPAAFRTVIAGLLQMETDPADCAGAVFMARKANQ